MKHDKATNNNHYADLLILAALPKETFILNKIFAKTGTIFVHKFTKLDTHDTFPMPCVEVSLQDSGSVRIAWMDLHGMCNVFAYDKALEAISAACPRCTPDRHCRRKRDAPEARRRYLRPLHRLQLTPKDRIAVPDRLPRRIRNSKEPHSEGAPASRDS